MPRFLVASRFRRFNANLGFAEVLQVVEGLAGAEQRTNGDGQHVNPLVILGAVHARVGQVFETFDQAELGMFLHPGMNHKSAQAGPIKRLARAVPKIFRCVCPVQADNTY